MYYIDCFIILYLLQHLYFHISYFNCIIYAQHSYKQNAHHYGFKEWNDCMPDE